MKINRLRLENVAGIMVGQQRESIDIDFGASRNRIISIHGNNASGKAILTTTYLPCPHGTIQACDVRVGDYLFNRIGEPTRVLGVYPQGLKSVYQIFFSDGRRVSCSKNHLWQVEMMQGGRRIRKVLTTMEIKALENRKDIRIPTNFRVEYDYEMTRQYLADGENMDPMDPWLFGFLLVNGYEDTDNNLFTLNTTKEIVDRINGLIGTTYNFSAIGPNGMGKYHCSKRDRYVQAADLGTFGQVVKLKPGNRSIPEIFHYLSTDNREKLVEGILNCGPIHTWLSDEYRYELPDDCGWKADLLSIIRSLGHHARINGNTMVIRRLDPMSTDRSVGIEAIVPTGVKRDMVCFKVDNSDGLFLMNGFIVTHNTTVLSSLHPFSSVSSTDERSGVSYVVEGKQGTKEISFIDGKKRYDILHRYRPTRDHGHTVKSYFRLDGEELNENGNVGSFLTLVENHMGITPDTMRLIRLGTNVSSFVSLRPTERKSYLGKMIEETEVYARIQRKLTDDQRLLRSLISANSVGLSSTGITDPKQSKRRKESLEKDLSTHNLARDKLKARLSELTVLERDNSVGELRSRQSDTVSALDRLTGTRKQLKERHIDPDSLDSLNSRIEALTTEQQRLETEHTRLMLSGDAMHGRVSQLTSTIKSLSIDTDASQLKCLIDDTRATLARFPKEVTLVPLSEYSSERIRYLVDRLSGFNGIGSVIRSLGSKPISLYLSLVRSGKSVDAFIREQSKKRLSSLGDGTIREMISSVFRDEGIVSPSCYDQFHDCPYYRFARVVSEFRSLDQGETDEETLRLLGTLNGTMDTVLSGLDSLRKITVPESLSVIMDEDSLLRNLESGSVLFDTTELESFLSLVMEAEKYQVTVDRLARYEHELAVYRKAGVDDYQSELDSLLVSIRENDERLISLKAEIGDTTTKLNSLISDRDLLRSYHDQVKYESLLLSSLETIKRTLVPLESIDAEKGSLLVSLTTTEKQIADTTREIQTIVERLSTHKSLSAENKRLASVSANVAMILEAVSTRKGIPLAYINHYLTRIRRITNNLLSIIYGDDMMIDEFVVTPDSFEIPYIRDGNKVQDIRFASQSESAMVTMALSFALSHGANQKYGILLLDEIDSGLDETNRASFLMMLAQQMDELRSEQAFIISQTLDRIVTVPMDVIRLSGDLPVSSIQNVIYG